MFTYLVLWTAFDWATRQATPSTLVDSPVVRSLAAAGISLLLALGGGACLIPRLGRRSIATGTSASATLNALHQHKQATPSMGGLFVLAALLATLGLFADLGSASVKAAVVICLGLGAVGAADDLAKLCGNRRGLTARIKLAGQLVVAAIAGLLLHVAPGGLARIELGGVDLSWPVTLVVIVGASNAFNLTDGLDGLAASCSLWATAAFGWLLWFGYRAAAITDPTAPAVDELLVLAGAILGSVLGFLYFNRRPARVFLGDTGALPLGGLLGMLALACAQPLAVAVISTVFLVELASVVLQVGWFKLSGRRLLRCAPLHHHYQFLGWTEATIVRRFCLLAACCAVVGSVLACGSRKDAGRRFSAAPVLPASTSQFR